MLAFASSERLCVALTALLSIAACQGERAPPLRGGDGVIVSHEDGVVVRIDDTRIPVVPSSGCADGELVYRASARAWACASPASLFADVPLERQPVAASELGALAVRVTELEAQVASLDRCSELPPAIRPPNYVRSPASCLVIDGTGNTNDAYHFEDGWLVMHAMGEVRVVCDLTERCDGSDRRWDRASFWVRDPDGVGVEDSVSAEVRVNFVTQIPPCTNAPCGVVSSVVGNSTLTIDLGGYTPDFRGADVLSHYIMVSLKSARGGAAFGGVIID